MNIEKNIEKIKKIAYRWTCPEDGKIIEGPTEKKVKSDARQHIKLKHNGNGEKK